VNDWGSDVEKILVQATARRTAKTQDCLSHAQLDQLALGETEGAAREKAQAHLAACKSCVEMKAVLDHDRAAFLLEANVDALAADALARARLGDTAGGAVPWWRKVVPALTLLAAASAALVLMPRSRSHDAGTVGFTAKGGFGVAVYVLHTEGAASAPAANERGVLHLGEALHPGDRIRLQLSGGADASENRHPMVLAVDQTARVSVYFPAQEPAPELSVTASSKGAAVMARGGAAMDLDPAGADRERAPGQLLPTAIELDDTLGRETIIALNCRAPVTLDMARTAVRDATVHGAAGTTVRAGDLGLACQQARYVIEKVAR
jgi:hypothetical protein